MQYHNCMKYLTTSENVSLKELLKHYRQHKQDD